MALAFYNFLPCRLCLVFDVDFFLLIVIFDLRSNFGSYFDFTVCSPKLVFYHMFYNLLLGLINGMALLKSFCVDICYLVAVTVHEQDDRNVEVNLVTVICCGYYHIIVIYHKSLVSYCT